MFGNRGAVRHENGDPHESHRWENRPEQSSAWPWVCAYCDLNIEDDSALNPCLSAPTEREERESETWLIAVAVVNLCDGEPEHVAGVADYLTEKLARLRTHSPEEPVGVDRKAGKRREGFAALYALVYPIVVAVGREHGYAMGLHGSLARDLDVIAAPWAEEPSSPADVVADICHRLGAIVGEDLCTVPPERGPPKPHREAWNVVLRGGAFLDISFPISQPLATQDPNAGGPDE